LSPLCVCVCYVRVSLSCVCVCARLRRAAASASRTERTGKKKKVERCYKRQRGLALGLNAFITRFVGSQCCREQTHTHTISHCLRPLYCRCVYACERVGGGAAAVIRN
jgi:hypothetical protein